MIDGSCCMNSTALTCILELSHVNIAERNGAAAAAEVKLKQHQNLANYSHKLKRIASKPQLKRTTMIG
jgi:hypothetical protein